MKQKFISLISAYIIPWVDGANGTPWFFTTDKLVAFGNLNLRPEMIVNKDGDMKPVYLTRDDVNEAMAELGFNQAGFIDPYAGLSTVWEVEALPTLIL